MTPFLKWTLFGRLFLRTLSVKVSYQGDKSESVRSFANCFFHAYTGGLYPKKGEFYEPSAFLPSKVDKIIKSGRFLRIKRLRCATTISHGPWDNFYHWYIDSIPRLWNLHRADISAYNNIILPITRKISNDELRLIKCLLPQNVSVVQVEKDSLYATDLFVFLPFLSGDRSGRLPKEYLDFYRRKVFKEFALEQKVSRSRIFISRRSCNKRSFINQDAVEEYLAMKGFINLQLEHLPIREQMMHFANASLIVASHGAGLTNLLYASSCTVVEIFHSCEDIGLNHYRDLAQALNLNYNCFCLAGGHKNERVYLPIDLLEEKLSQYCDV